MPVATAPATEMCGSDGRLCSARPSAWSPAAISPRRMPALTVATVRSAAISRRGGRPATDTRSPVVSATGLNECPVPRVRNRSLARTIAWSASTLSGRRTLAARNRTFPAQFAAGDRLIASTSAGPRARSRPSGRARRPRSRPRPCGVASITLSPSRARSASRMASTGSGASDATRMTLPPWLPATASAGRAPRRARTPRGASPAPLARTAAAGSR